MTVKTLIPLATSPLVVTVIDSWPAGAESLTVISAAMVVGLVTLQLLMSTLGKESVVTPCSQLVLVPLMVTGTSWPWPADEGEMLLMTAGPGLT